MAPHGDLDRWQSVARSVVVTALVALLVAGIVTPSHGSEKWGPFRGQLVDQATGQGHPGAAVIAVWWKNEPNPMQMNRSFFDAIEAVTDADGRFEIPRYPKPPFFDFQIFLPEITYFAPGYLSDPERRHTARRPGIHRADSGPRWSALRSSNPTDKLVGAIRGRPGGVPLEEIEGVHPSGERGEGHERAATIPGPGGGLFPWMSKESRREAQRLAMALAACLILVPASTFALNQPTHARS